jgi:hypothetical protein
MTQKQTEFIGFLVNEGLDDILRLQSVLLGVSKGALIRQIVESYVEVRELELDDLLARYAEYIYSKWYTRYRDVKTFEEYVIEAEDDMKNKHKLAEKLIKLTLQKCNDLHENQ